MGTVRHVTSPGAPVLTTAEAATRAGIAPATLRAWAHRGHLTPAGADDRGRPLYAPDDVTATAAAMHERRSRTAQTRDDAGRFGSA